MAIFHLTAKVISRGAGQSAVAAAAYQARDRLLDERDGLVKDYSRKSGQELLFSGIFAPQDAPDWARDRGQLWNRAEAAEKRRDAQTARSLELSLPHELTPEQGRYAVQDFIRDNFTRKGFVVDLNIHGAERGGDERNTHAHLLVTMRTLEGGQFNAKKDRSQNSKDTLAHWRESWARTANRHLERHGHAARLDHRSLEAQGIDREATQHLGPAATRQERRGEGSERGELNREAAARHAEGAALREEQAEVEAKLREAEYLEGLHRRYHAPPRGRQPLPPRGESAKERAERLAAAAIWRDYHEDIERINEENRERRAAQLDQLYGAGRKARFRAELTEHRQQPAHLGATNDNSGTARQENRPAPLSEAAPAFNQTSQPRNDNSPPPFQGVPAVKATPPPAPSPAEAPQAKPGAPTENRAPTEKKRASGRRMTRTPPRGPRPGG